MGGEEGWPARCTPELPAGDVFLSLQQHLPALRRTRRRTERSARSAQRNSGGCGSALGKGRGEPEEPKGSPPHTELPRCSRSAHHLRRVTLG